MTVSYSSIVLTIFRIFVVFFVIIQSNLKKEENYSVLNTKTVASVSECVGFNIPLDTLYVISGTIFTGQVTKPTVSKHWRKPVGRQRSGLNPTRSTPSCFNNTTLGNWLYVQRNGPNVTNPICWTCKNCSHKCAADCEHCVTQSSTELFW